MHAVVRARFEKEEELQLTFDVHVDLLPLVVGDAVGVKKIHPFEHTTKKVTFEILTAAAADQDLKYSPVFILKVVNNCLRRLPSSDLLILS